MIILAEKELIFLRVDYYRPDFQHILQEFCFDVMDVWPTIPRVFKFLKYWETNIEAEIEGVEAHNYYRNLRISL
jgi:uncharacterized protein Usg